MIIIKMITSNANNDNHNIGQAFRTDVSIELTYQVIASLIFQVPGTKVTPLIKNGLIADSSNKLLQSTLNTTNNLINTMEL